MLAYARSRSLPNAPIARTIIWIRSSKLHFSSAAAFGFFSRARRRALGGAGFALGTPVERSRGSLVGRTGIVPPGRWGRSGLLRRRVGLRRSSVGELRSAADAPFASLRTPENHKIIRSAFVSRDSRVAGYHRSLQITPSAVAVESCTMFVVEDRCFGCQR